MQVMEEIDDNCGFRILETLESRKGEEALGLHNVCKAWCDPVQK